MGLPAQDRAAEVTCSGYRRARATPIVRSPYPRESPTMLRNLSVRARLVGLVFFINLLLAGSAGYAWYAIAQMNDRMDRGFADEQKLAAAGDLARQVQVNFKIQVQ